MFSTCIRHNQFILTIKAYSPSAATHVLNFLNHLPQGFIVVENLAGHGSLTVITADNDAELISKKSDKSLLPALQRAWKSLEPTWKGSSLLHVDKQGDLHSSLDFVYLVNSGKPVAETYPLIVHYIYLLERHKLLEENKYLIHGSGIISRGRGFLFLGQSGAGKSTVSSLSEHPSNVILHDEKILIEQDGSDFYLMRLTLENKIEYRSKLTSIFILKKDTQDFLTPANYIDKAYELVDAFFEKSGALVLSQTKLQVMLKLLSTLSRSVPGFELHFRKSSDFWKVINERFPA